MAGTLTVQNIQGPASGANAGKIIIPSGHTLDASAGFLPPAGSVVQVVQGYNSGRYSTTGLTKVSLVTSPSITPSSASNKILVGITTIVARGGANSSAYFEVRRGSSTSLLQAGQTLHFSHWNDYSTGTQNNTTWQYLDSPNTTSPVSYQIFGNSDGGTTSAILGGRGSDDGHNCGVNWILMEIAG